MYLTGTSASDRLTGRVRPTRGVGTARTVRAEGEGCLMASYRPAHAKSGLGRYTAPRRLNPLHAVPSTDTVRFAKVAGTVIGGGLLASAGLLGLASANAGAASISGTSPPLSSLGTTITDPDGSTATVAGGGGTISSPGTAFAEAGVGTSANLDDNHAFSFGFGPGNDALS